MISVPDKQYLGSVFDDDYLYFYEELLGKDRSTRDADCIWDILELRPNMRVLDLGCGHGRLANILAKRGASVTGLDIIPAFLDRARAEANAKKVEVSYIYGDMRSLPWSEGEFDRVFNWYTSFGLLDDADNRQILREVRRVLKRGGQFALELSNRDHALKHFQQAAVVERDGNFLIDQYDVELQAGRMRTTRRVLRNGRRRQFIFTVRMFTPVELRSWLDEAGFASAEVLNLAGEPVSLDDPRIVAVART